MKKLNILQLNSASFFGGGEKHVYQLINGLSTKEHHVILVVKERIKNNFLDLDVTIKTLPLQNALDIKSIFALAKLIKDEKIDIIHLHHGRDYWLGILATIVAQRGKIIITRHISHSLGHSYFHKKLYTRVSKFIAVSKQVKNILVQQNKISTDKINLIYNGVNLDKFNFDQTMDKNLKKELNIKHNELVIATIGRLIEYKNQELLINVAAKIKNKEENIKYLIIGTDNSPKQSYHKKLIKKIKRLNLENQVVLTGFRKDIDKLLKIIDILVIPSKEESFGLVAIEAMAMKTPIIATKVGGLKEIIQDGSTGFLVSLQENKFREAIMKLITQPQVRAEFGKAGYNRVIDKFTTTTMINKTEKLYLELNHS